MNPPSKRLSLNHVNLVAVLIGGVFLIAFVGLVLYQEYVKFQKEITDLRDEYLKEQKTIIAHEVERALHYIHYRYELERSDRPEEILKKEVIDYIERMRNERDEAGYLFIYDFDGTSISDRQHHGNVGKNLYEFTDPSGIKVLQEMIDVSKEPYGGYVQYLWTRPVQMIPVPKITYAKAFFPWGWTVGTGVYLDSIEAVVNERAEKYRKEVMQFGSRIFLIGLLLLSVAAWFTRRIGTILNRETSQMMLFFNKAATDHEAIKDTELTFREFEVISHHANTILSELMESKNELQELNKHLEDKVEDKTQKLRLQAENLSNLVKSQDTFIRHAIHEIYTPLNIIFVNSELIVMKQGESSHLRKIGAAAKTIQNIYNDLSYIIKKDRTEYLSERVDLSAFVQNRADYFSELAEGNGVFIRTEIESGLFADINSIELERLCDNNISNAIKYSFENETIQIRLQKTSTTAIVSFTNKGRPVKNTEMLFEPYYRENESRGGFGVGLSIVKEICDKNMIDIDVESSQDFTRFTYRFPLSKGTA